MRHPGGIQRQRLSPLPLLALCIAACAGEWDDGPVGPDGPAAAPPARPAGLHGRAITSTWVSLTWLDQSPDELGFRLYRGVSPSEVNQVVVNRAANVESYDDTGLVGSTTYYYHLYSFNDHGQSASFDEAVVETPPAAGPPAIRLSGDYLQFHGSGGAPAPRPQTILVTNIGDSPATDLAVSVSYSSGDGWLEANLGGPVAPTKLFVNVYPDRVPIGEHAATISLSSPLATNSPRTASVRMAVPCSAVVLGGLGRAAYGYGVNDVGHVVGEAYDQSDRRYAYMWRDGEVVDLGSLGGEWFEVRDLNNSGQAVGWSETAQGYNHAFLWQDGEMYDLEPWAEYYSYASAINEAGLVVGRHESEAVKWEDGRMTHVTTPRNRAFAEANGVNNLGQIVGSYSSGSGEHAFLSDGGVATDLGTLGGCCSAALDINDRGQVVGWSEVASGEQRPFLWQDGQMAELPTTSFTWATAVSINNSGQIAGRGWAHEADEYALLWNEGELTLLGPADSHAEAINEFGQVVGSVSVSGSSAALLWCSDH